MNVSERPNRRARHFALVSLVAAVALVTAYANDDNASLAATTPTTTSPATTTTGHGIDQEMDPADRAAAVLGTAGYQDVATAESAGYASSLDTLGCFTDPERGGMGLHYIDQRLMDDQVDIAEPEALVYELDADGYITGLVAHEYIVPIDAWTKPAPPQLFGMDFHQHPTLPLWILHAWLWKDNPSGIFEDWNPAVRQCPPGVPIFGQDLPAAALSPTVVAASASATPSPLQPHYEEHPVTSFPSIAHIAVTVRDLDVSVPWYSALFDADPVLDEDTGPFRHVVWSLGDTLLGLHQFPNGDDADSFDVHRPGLDHIAFACPDRTTLDTWRARLDELGIVHGDILDASYGSGLSFKDPDNLPLEFFAPPM